MQETWEKSSGPFQIRRLAEHYGVFRDLFPMAYFLPQVPLRICYSQDNSGQVHYGNRLTPSEVCSSFTVFSFCLVVKVLKLLNIYSLTIFSVVFLLSRQHLPLRSALMQRRAPCGPFCSPVQVSSSSFSFFFFFRGKSSWCTISIYQLSKTKEWSFFLSRWAPAG